MNKLMFNYSAGLNETQENLVIAFNELVSDYRSKKSSTKEYKENNAKFSEALVKYCVESAGLEFSGMEMIKNPQLSMHNSFFTETFATQIAEMITPAVPDVMSEEFNTLWDVQQVGWGNNAKYEVDSNEYFVVYDIND